MNENLSTAILTATGMDPNPMPQLDDPYQIMRHIEEMTGYCELLTVDEFKDEYYDDKWKSQGMTAYHPERLPDLWTQTGNYNWILLGDKKNQAIAVVNGKIDPNHKVSRFKVTNILKMGTKNSPVERGSEAPGGPTPRENCTPPRNGGKPGPSGVSTDIPKPENPNLETSAVYYAAWALDCLRRKHYADAEQHLITALKRSDYYKKGQH